MHTKFLKPYDPKNTEEKIYTLWEKSGFFNPDTCVEKGVCDKDAETFVITLPPPNVTGVLHLGHAYENSIQDALIRFARMNGKRTLWVPGTDSAAIATQARVEKNIKKDENKTRHDLGRRKLVKRIQIYAKESEKTILGQVKKMGASLDWSRYAYTLDEKRNIAVSTAFKKMYAAGLIYRGHRIVNWDPKGQTTISDDEVIYKEETSKFYYLKYGPFTIATARPETKFGDKYVVIHPDDKRYKAYKHGQKIDLEWINGLITATIIKDKASDPEVGSGVMTITPWHSMIDFEIAERHNLDKEQIIDTYGKLLPIAGEFTGMKITEAREKIVEKLEAKGLVEKIEENYVHNLATSERTGATIEPQIMEQWFVDVNAKFKVQNSKIKGIKDNQSITLKELMRTAVESEAITMPQEGFKKSYFHWIDNLHDWCISRQIWYGHRIPVWYKKPSRDENEIVMGFHERTVSQVLNGKTKTYRTRNHGWKKEDTFLFENSQSKELFGRGVIQNVEKIPAKYIPLDDKTHGATYKSQRELIEALQFHAPDRTINEETPVWTYEYSFEPLTKEVYVGDTPPGQDNWVQDEDVLDTWFSSALWTFSTLGWPKQTEDLENYHPTTFMSPAYEILFLWISRMILMSGFHLGEIPFKTVMLHGLVRDSKGQKFSKSLGNGIDPLEIIDTYGADALRMGLLVGTPIGNDISFEENKIKGYKLFTNKLWNITRFVLENSEDIAYDKNFTKHTDSDTQYIAERDTLISDVTKDMENYRLYLAAEKLYHYTWHTFADKILEDSKLTFESVNNNEIVSRKQFLMQTLAKIVITLHPFMPFITEEIWKELPYKETDLLMVTRWPRT